MTNDTIRFSSLYERLKSNTDVLKYAFQQRQFEARRFGVKSRTDKRSTYATLFSRIYRVNCYFNVATINAYAANDQTPHGQHQKTFNSFHFSRTRLINECASRNSFVKPCRICRSFLLNAAVVVVRLRCQPIANNAMPNANPRSNSSNVVSFSSSNKNRTTNPPLQSTSDTVTHSIAIHSENAQQRHIVVRNRYVAIADFKSKMFFATFDSQIVVIQLQNK